MMCSLCWAGLEEFPFEDLADTPQWSQTLHRSRPWTNTPVLSLVPGVAAPETLYLLDPFHLFKVGMGRDLAGSTIAICCKLGCWDEVNDLHESKALDARLKRAHSCFTLWASVNGYAPGLRSFTPTFFNIENRASQAWCNTKGSDTQMVLKFILWFMRLKLLSASDFPAAQVRFFKVVKHTVQCGLELFDLLHSHGLWLHRDCAKVAYIRIMILLRGYKKLAALSMGLGFPGFGLKPKLHGMHHLAWSMKESLKRGAPRVLSPIFAGCESNEDTVGRISRLSKKVSTRTLTRRLMDRHLLKKYSLIRRSQDEGKPATGSRSTLRRKR